MTITLDLGPDVEMTLAAQARATGISLNDYLQSVIEDLARAGAAHPVSPRDIEETLDLLAEMGRGLPQLPSSAFIRESIYQDLD